MTVNHGDFVSLYGNLSAIYVAPGTVVEEGQVIARAGTNDEPNGEALFFGLFEDGVEADPEIWLGSKKPAAPAAQ